MRKRNPVNETQLPTAISGKLICGQRAGAPADANNRWQEEHVVAGGQLFDYKLGPGHPVDPRKLVGTWSITGNGANTRVEYRYGSGSTTSGPYPHSVHDAGGGTYEFCTGPGGTLVARAVIQAIGGACSAYPAP